MPERRSLRLRDRTAYSLVAMALAAMASELVRAWPGAAPGSGFGLVLVAQVAVVSVLWTAPLALAFAGAVAGRGLAARRWGGETEPDPAVARPVSSLTTALPLAPPAALLMVSVGAVALRWAAGAFVRPELAAAVMPVVLLVAFAAIAGVAALVHAALRARLARLPGWALAAATAAGALAAVAIHLARVPALLDDARLPALLQIVLVAALGALVFGALRAARWRPGWPGLGGIGAGWLALFVVLALGGRIAPLSYPVASAALAGRGLVAARVVPLLGRLGDRDGDGFARWFGGLDCDDGDPAIHPLAKDAPGDGVDQDCFEGDLSPAAVAADAAARAADRRPPRKRIDSVLLITVDALRADAVGFGGGTRARTPNLDRLAARSTVFDSAWTSAPMTRRAFPALLAGRYPSNVHWRKLATSYPYTVSEADNVFVAELARDAGLRTGMALAFGYAGNARFDQGFVDQKVRPASKYKDETNADVVVGDAIDLLEGWSRPATAAAPPRFFLWVHFYEAHFPYVEHPRHRIGGTPHDRYLSEVAWIDEQIGVLLARLGTLGLAERTAIVFTGDHGEEFGEHGGETHGDLYPEDLRVPLLIHLPGAAARRLPVAARSIDVAPTVAELLGLEAPPSFDGASLVPALEGAPPVERPRFAELIPDLKVPRRVVSLADGGWQLIVDFGLGSRELYHLAADPTAQRNLLADEPAQAAAMERALRRHMALRVGPLRVTVEPPALSTRRDDRSPVGAMPAPGAETHGRPRRSSEAE